MSGGHNQYKYQTLNLLADEIESDLLDDNLKNDILCNRKIELEVISLITDLKKMAKRAKAYEWYMSGDTGEESYLEELERITNETK